MTRLFASIGNDRLALPRFGLVRRLGSSELLRRLRRPVSRRGRAFGEFAWRVVDCVSAVVEGLSMPHLLTDLLIAFGVVIVFDILFVIAALFRASARRAARCRGGAYDSY